MSETLPAGTRPGVVTLIVPDLERSLEFYQRSLGMSVHQQKGNQVSLGARGGQDILVLIEEPNATQPPRHATGLYHLAILLPSRLALAQALLRLASSGWPVQGASDHLVSEAIYLADPDGNGIEVYHDRPRPQWSYRNGQVQMATLPLDVDGVLSEVQNENGELVEQPAGLPASTVLGHVHLKVADIDHAEAFYTGVLGFQLMARYGQSAAFVSAGGYHHHIGFNVWESAGASPPPAGSAGLRDFTILLPDEAALGRVIDRVRSAGLSANKQDHGYLVHDPSQNGVLLRSTP